ncbi:unannotated protein [freshwater metagenome]|uniref:Unannotated protein n=1 Tax=freshwater metagenome TaxID=449393 RepID=A0A6J6EC74_9ZZZZ
MTIAVRARIPPSPWLSAFMTKVRYLMEMMMTRAQKASEATPKAYTGFEASRCWCSKASRNAYNGEVPMSPYTIPRAPSARAPIPALWPP